ncbi:MAG TPA: hypothetical protein VGM97_02000, partial [Steroidobacteraceae bacterium]
LVDRFRSTGVLVGGILTLLALALLSVPAAMRLGPIGYLSFALWGAMGWSCHASQQNRLLELAPEQASSAIALNNSCNYLGSAAGAMFGGVLIAFGMNAANLPYLAALAVLVALSIHVLSQWQVSGARQGL